MYRAVHCISSCPPTSHMPQSHTPITMLHTYTHPSDGRMQDPLASTRKLSFPRAYASRGQTVQHGPSEAHQPLTSVPFWEAFVRSPVGRAMHNYAVPSASAPPPIIRQKSMLAVSLLSPNPMDRHSSASASLLRVVVRNLRAFIELLCVPRR